MSAALPRFSFNMQIHHAARDEKQKTDIKRQNDRLPDYPFSKSAWQALLTRPARQASNPSSLQCPAANRWPNKSQRTLLNQNRFYSPLHTPAPPPRWAAKREQGSAFRCPRPAYENEHDYKSEYDYNYGYDYAYDYEGYSAAFRWIPLHFAPPRLCRAPPLPPAEWFPHFLCRRKHRFFPLCIFCVGFAGLPVAVNLRFQHPKGQLHQGILPLVALPLKPVVKGRPHQCPELGIT